MKRIVALLVFIGLLTVSLVGFAKIKKTGTWPEHEKTISLDANHVTRADAIKKLAEVAAWSVVVSGPADSGASSLSTDAIDVHVNDQEPAKILGILLADGDYSADRDGTLITIAPAVADVPGSPPATPAITNVAPSPSIETPKTVRGEDRKISGSAQTINADEIVHDVSVAGGKLDLYGTVTGNLTVAGGSAHVRKGAHVVGNAIAIGGSIEIDDGAEIDGSVDALGGSIRRKGHVSAGVIHDAAPDAVRIVSDIGEAVTRTAVLFVFGAVLLALAGSKMEMFRVEIALRPMRTFALGIVGVIGGALTLVTLCIAVVGIPVAIVLAILAPFAAFAGICSVLGTAGKALIGHKTSNPYLHLAFGCLLFLVSGAIPYVDGIVTFIVMMMGIGVVVGTRGAGYWPTRKKKFGSNPAPVAM